MASIPATSTSRGAVARQRHALRILTSPRTAMQRRRRVRLRGWLAIEGQRILAASVVRAQEAAGSAGSAGFEHPGGEGRSLQRLGACHGGASEFLAELWGSSLRRGSRSCHEEYAGAEYVS